MAEILIAGHLALFLASLVVVWKSRTRLISCLAIAPGVGFLYTSVFQAREALQHPAPDLLIGDMADGLLVSFLSYLALLAGYWLVRPSAKKIWFKDEDINTGRINLIGLVFFAVGIIGHWMFMRAVGGFGAYFGAEEWIADPYEMSGYVYILRNGIIGAAAMWFISGALGKLPLTYLVPFIFSLAFLLLQGILDTSRGETIRASLLIIGTIYFSSCRWGCAGRVLAIVLMGIFAVGATLSVLLLPSFRDQGRKITMSETTIEEAVEEVQESNRAEKGGEFDSGVRIVKRTSSGEIGHPGPVHIARFLWNSVPRKLVPYKHEMFERWAGADYMEIRIGSTAYYGCAPSGWGEAYGCMGWFGALLYWSLFGAILKMAESRMGRSMIGLLMGAAFFLPLMQYVGIDLWVGSMGLCTTVLPVLVLLFLFCRRPAAHPTKNRNNVQARRQHTERNSKAGRLST